MSISVDFCEVYCLDTEAFCAVESEPADSLQAALQALGCYEEVDGKEFLRLTGKNISLIDGVAGTFHIYRKRDLPSLAGYLYLQTFSTEWEEIILQVGDTSEKVLIQKVDGGNIDVDDAKK